MDADSASGKRMRMKNPLLKTLLVAGIFHLAPAQARDALPPVQTPVPDAHLVTVNGEGEVTGTPDRARLSMAVEETGSQLKTTQADVNRIVREYLAQARALGAADEDISTAGLEIRAEYDFSGKDGRKFIGYHVTRSILVTVHDLDRIGDFLQRATDAGINSVSDPQLESSKAEELRREALAKAAQDAQAKARVVADALGVKLGPVHTVNASAEPQPPPRPRLMMATAMAAPSGNDEMGFAAGEIRYTATVTAEFELLPRE
jgi:uncharacterized protein YggE